MVGQKIVCIVVSLLLLLSLVPVTATPFAAKAFQIQPKLIKQIQLPTKVIYTPTNNEKPSLKTTPFITKNKKFLPSKITGKQVAIPLGGKEGKDKQNIEDLCDTPGFACGGAPGSYIYGSGDVIRYNPDATDDLSSGSGEPWFHLEPTVERGTITPEDLANDAWRSAFHTVVDNEYMVYGACLVARMEFDSINVPDFTDNDEQNSFSASAAVDRTEDVINTCQRYDATPRAYSCAYGANQWWNSWKVLNPQHPNDAETLGVTIAYFGELAACDFQLRVTQGPTVEVTNHETGSVVINWRTSLKASERVDLTNIDTAEVTTVTGSSLGPRDHSLTYSGLEPGTYNAVVRSAITEDDPLVIQQSLVLSPVEFTIEREATIPTLTYSGATPAPGASLASDSATVTISASEPLTSATLHLTKPDSTTVDYAMTGAGSSRSVTLTGLHAGLNSYNVEVVDAEGDEATSATRTFTVPSPSASFVSPTPTSGASQVSTSATISISASESLTSASLSWTSPSGTTTYPMAGSGTSYSYTITGLATGGHSYSVSITDDEGDSATTSSRTLTISPPSVDAPVLTYVPPTPIDGALLVSDDQEIRVSSSESLTSATLYLRKPDGSTTPHALSLVSGTTYSVTLSGLRVGSNEYYVEATDTEGETGVSETRDFTVPNALLSFVSPTPTSGTSLSIDSATVTISANDGLTSATLVISDSQGTREETMTGSGSSRSVTLTGLHAGINTYHVEAIDTEGDETTTTEQTFNVPLPTVTFTGATPVNGATQSETSAVISVSLSESVTSATLVWASPTSSTSYVMTGSGLSRSYTVSSLAVGSHSYRVDIVDDEGDAATSETRTLTVSTVASPPSVDFVSPTPLTGATLAGDNMTISISASEPLTSATLTITDSRGSRDVAMTGAGSTRSATLSNLYNGTNTFSVSVIDDDGESGESEERSVVVPVTFQVKVFEGEAVGSMAVFNVDGTPTMFVGTFNETLGTYMCWGGAPRQQAIGRAHVYKSTDGENWELAFTGESNTTCTEPGNEGSYNQMTGVYSMAVYDDGAGEALYIGTGAAFIAGSIAGEIYRTYDGETWERVYQLDSQRVITLHVIDGTLYAGVREASIGAGHLMWYNSTDNWLRVGAGYEVRAVGGYNGNIYYVDQFGGVYQRGLEGSGAIADIPTGNAMLEHNGKLFAGVSSGDDNSLYKTEDPTSWEYEAVPGSNMIWNLRELSDDHMYITISRTDLAKLWRRNGIEANEFVVDFGTNDRAVDVVEFNGRKYVGIVDRIGSTGTNRWGYLYALTV